MFNICTHVVLLSSDLQGSLCLPICQLIHSFVTLNTKCLCSASQNNGFQLGWRRTFCNKDKLSVRVKRKTHSQLKKKDNTVRTVRGRYILKKKMERRGDNSRFKKNQTLFLEVVWSKSQILLYLLRKVTPKLRFLMTKARSIGFIILLHMHINLQIKVQKKHQDLMFRREKKFNIKFYFIFFFLFAPTWRGALGT